jgi:hypothetical protein
MVIQIPPDDVYKMHDIGSNTIYIFGGIYTEISNIFSNSELEKLKKNETKILKSKHYINKTDTISAIKQKLILTMIDIDTSNSLKEPNIYLFATKNVIVNIEKIYRENTNDEEFPFTHNMLMKLVSNIVSIDVNKIKVQPFYSFEEIVKIIEIHENDEILVNIPIGLDEKLFDNNPLFIVNPFYNHSESIESMIIDRIKNPNSKLLFEYFPLHDNNMYFCLETDLELNQNVLNTYFPKYETKDISIDKFITQDNFHNMYHSRKNDLPYELYGIESLDVSLLSNIEKDKFIPLGEIFKNIHATDSILFINYNPGYGKENILRLHSTNVSRNGKIIPVMPKKEIDKVHARMNNKPKSISAFIIIDEVEIYIDLYKEGLIQIRSEHKKSPMIPTSWNLVLQKALNPFISQINTFLVSSGFKINLFESIQKEQINALKFVMSIDVNDKISLMKKIPCLTHVFDIYNDEVSNLQNIDIRFKDVKEFNSNDAQILLILSSEDPDEQFKLLTANYHMTHVDATNRIRRYLSDESDKNTSNITTQYGFLVSMKLIENKLFIDINDIDSIDYLYDIKIYIDCILRITQKVFSDSYSLKYDFKQCSKKFDTSKYRSYNILDEDNVDDDDEDAKNFDEVDNGDDYAGEDLDVNFDNFNIDDDESVVNNEVNSNDDIDINFDNFNIDENEPDGIAKDGTSLNEYFLKKLKVSEPKLFTYEAKDGYTSYSRLCDSNLDRQPVVISDTDKQRIDKEHPGSYSHALRYGSDKDQQNHKWFICPRYWCLKTNSSMTQEEVDSGVCGGIIPRTSKVIPHGKYVYEFDSGTDKHHEKPVLKDGKITKGEYVHNGPGFLKTKTPDGQCLPCCFKLWNSKSQKDKRAECTQTIVEENDTNIGIDTNTDNKYVSGHQISPIDKNRWGFLPISVQKFLNTNQEESQSKKNTAYILPNKKCLLRYGVEKSNNQSFIACISEIYSYKHKGKIQPPTITNMKKIIANSVNLDKFIRLNNGTLVNIFKSSNIDNNKLEVYAEKYKNSEFIQSLNTNEQKKFLIVDTISSYENYLSYILDESSVIDHTYLWDLVIDMNQELMSNGLNLVIIEVTNDDITENVSILCPTNSHNVLYDSSRDTMILLKNGMYYEPIYQYEEKNNVLQIKKSFTESSATPGFLKSLLNIKKIQTRYCSPNPSRESNVYTFKRNISSNELIVKLTAINYVVKYQVSNYQTKCIGFYVFAEGDTIQNGIFIPCFPSELIKNHEIKFMDDHLLWHSFDNTIMRLQKIKQLSNGEINCAPSIIVQDDLLFVGILTETNQFIQLSAPEITINSSKLPIVKKSNYNSIDKLITTEKEEDLHRISVIRKIYLEQQFYIAFRTVVRVHLNDYYNRAHKKELFDIYHSDALYKVKLHSCIKILLILLGNKVTFVKMTDEFMNSYVNITDDTCSGKFCITSGDSLIVPDYNLVSGYENKILYFGKLADELIRNRRTQLFLLDTTYFVTVPNTQYTINKNELLIVRSLLTDEYFKNIKPFNRSSYVKNITYDNSEPNFHNNVNPYTNHIDIHESGVDTEIMTDKTNALVDESDVLIDESDVLIDEADVIIDETDVNDNEEFATNGCVSGVSKVTGNAVAKWRFGRTITAKEVHFNTDIICGFSLISHIMHQEGITVPEDNVKYLKKTLCSGFKKHYDIHGKNIVSILKSQGKIELMNNLVKNKLEICDLVMLDEYYLTDLDIWIICEELKLPVVLFTAGKMKSTKLNWLYLSSVIDDFHGKLHFIRTPTNNTSNLPLSYSLITPSMKYGEIRGDMKDVLKTSSHTDPNRMNVVDRLKTIYIAK